MSLPIVKTIKSATCWKVARSPAGDSSVWVMRCLWLTSEFYRRGVDLKTPQVDTLPIGTSPKFGAIGCCLITVEPLNHGVMTSPECFHLAAVPGSIPEFRIGHALGTVLPLLEVLRSCMSANRSVGHGVSVVDDSHTLP